MRSKAFHVFLSAPVEHHGICRGIKQKASRSFWLREAFVLGDGMLICDMALYSSRLLRASQ
jgi:hypothetical protein